MPPFTKWPAVAWLVLTFAALGGCQAKEPRDNQPSAQNAAAPSVENVAAKVLLPQPAMDRAGLLQAVASARSAAAAGVDDGEAQQQLDGKEFELRIRFGCDGPADSAKALPLAWSLDKSGNVLRVHAASSLSKDSPIIAAMSLQDVEGVEGFWIERPWLLKAICPVRPATPPTAPPADPSSKAVKPPTPAAQPQPKSEPQPSATAPKVAIAQFFSASDARTGRRDGRPYEAVKKLEDATPIGQQGFDLVLSGRLRALGGGRVIRCVASDPDAPPACVVSASFDHVWIEDAASKERIADWSSS